MVCGWYLPAHRYNSDQDNRSQPTPSWSPLSARICVICLRTISRCRALKATLFFSRSLPIASNHAHLKRWQIARGGSSCCCGGCLQVDVCVLSLCVLRHAKPTPIVGIVSATTSGCISRGAYPCSQWVYRIQKQTVYSGPTQSWRVWMCARNAKIFTNLRDSKEKSVSRLQAFAITGGGLCYHFAYIRNVDWFLVCTPSLFSIVLDLTNLRGVSLDLGQYYWRIRFNKIQDDRYPKLQVADYYRTKKVFAFRESGIFSPWVGFPRQTTPSLALTQSG